MGCESSKNVDVRPKHQEAVQSQTKDVQMLPRVEALQGDGGFVAVNDAGGAMCLSHYPGKKTLYNLKASGCDVVVTLQRDHEGAPKVRDICNTFRMQWYQADFWGYYYDKDAEGLHQHVVAIAKLIREGKKVMVHCAAGVHRTGMFAYAVLRQLDFTPEAAVKSLLALREVTYRKVGRHRILGIEELLGSRFPFAVPLCGEEGFLPQEVQDTPQSPAAAA